MILPDRWPITRTLFILCLLVPGWSITHAQAHREVSAPPFLDNPDNASIVIARVGNRTITAQEFLASYEFGPAFAKRETDSRHRYLHYMICEKLLALDADDLQLSRSDRARQTIAEIEGDLATEELYRKEIAGLIRIPETVINRGVARERRQLKLQWLYASTVTEIGRLQARLREGVPFDSLFTEFLVDSVRREDRSMEITRFRLQLRNPALSAIVDSLSQDRVSLPIHVDDGWYIVKLTREWQNPLTTETDDAKIREDVHRALVQHAADSLSDDYVNRLMVGRHPVIIRRSFDILQAWLAQTILKPEQFGRWDILGAAIRKWGPLDPTRVDPYLNDSLIVWSGGDMTIDDFVRWYQARSPNLKLRLTSPEAFSGSLEGYVWRMVRDRFLTDRAFAGNFQRRPMVRTQLNWWKDKIGYELRKSSLADSIEITDAALRAYYDEHPRSYRDRAGSPEPFDRVRDEVKKDYHAFRLTALMLHRLADLRNRYRVSIDEKALKRLRIDDENDPRSIDVYTVKTGGTFPRPAFPVIDTDWQGWE